MNQNVSSYAIDDGERLLLLDPLGVPSEIEERAPDGVATIPRSSVGDGSPGVVWLLEEVIGEAHIRGRRATAGTSVSRRLPEKNRTTWCSGWRAIARSSPATRHAQRPFDRTALERALS